MDNSYRIMVFRILLQALLGHEKWLTAVAEMVAHELGLSPYMATIQCRYTVLSTTYTIEMPIEMGLATSQMRQTLTCVSWMCLAMYGPKFDFNKTTRKNDMLVKNWGPALTVTCSAPNLFQSCPNQCFAAILGFVLGHRFPTQPYHQFFLNPVLSWTIP